MKRNHTTYHLIVRTNVYSPEIERSWFVSVRSRAPPFAARHGYALLTDVAQHSGEAVVLRSARWTGWPVKG